MSLPGHDRLSERFREAVSLPTDARRSFLERLQREDPEVAAELDSLLRHDADPPGFLVTGGAGGTLGPDPFLGKCLGPYRVLRRIGEGGMGVVYLASQQEPVRREVALKLIRPGFESRSVLARFASERRVLERLDHPHIARVLDAGVTGDARPYVVMEYVRGEPITAFADRCRLDVDARLRLLLLVCDAVQHAHQNAILHRDLKPSNVLVSLVDGRPVPKVIDFGIAKALSGDLEPTATLTEAGQLVGTPAYMSPEQARGSAEGVDTRADVYSLGCILHELLVGRPPFDPGELRGRTPEEVRSALLDHDPAPPSRCLSSSGSRTLAKRLRGELDWIVLKAIARERARRYASASELGADVRRCLEGEPVEARPPSAAYRLRKLAARHRTASAVLAVSLPLMTVFAIVTAIEARRIAAERDRAEETSEFLVSFYETPFWVTSRQGPLAPEELLLAGAKRVRQKLAARPVLAARVEHGLGEALRAIGEPGTARGLLEATHRRLASLLGAEHPTTLAAARDLAKADWDLGRFPEAQARFAAVLGAQRRTLGSSHLETLRTLAERGTLYKDMRRNAESAEALAEARAGLAAVLGPRHRETVNVTQLLGSVLLDLRRLDEAEVLLEEALASMGEDAEHRALVLYNLGCVHALRGEREEALRYLRRAQRRFHSIDWFADPNLASMLHDPVFVEVAKGALAYSENRRKRLAWRADRLVNERRYAEAEALYRYLVDLTPGAPDNGFRYPLGVLYRKAGRYAEAKPLVEHSLQLERGLDREDSQVGFRHLELAQVHLGLGNVAAALRSIDRAERIFAALPETSRSLRLYARASREAVQGEADAALSTLRASVEAGLSPDRIEDELVFRPLRGRGEFRELVALLHRRYDIP